MTTTLPDSGEARRVCVGVVAGAHGISGGVKIKSFTADPEAVGAYGPVSDETGGRYAIRVSGMQKGVVVAKLDGVTSRDAAEALRGLRLYVDRAMLPAAEDEEYYHADLIGLEARLSDGAPFGRIVGVWDFGAGDSLEIEPPSGSSVMMPFTRATVPVVDLAGGHVVIEPPAGLFDKPEPPASIEDQAAAAAEVFGAETEAAADTSVRGISVPGISVPGTGVRA